MSSASREHAYERTRTAEVRHYQCHHSSVRRNGRKRDGTPLHLKDTKLALHPALITRTMLGEEGKLSRIGRHEAKDEAVLGALLVDDHPQHEPHAHGRR